MAEESIYSLKMRAEANGRHISGAEKILPETAVGDFARALLERAMHHANGRPDFVNLKIEKLPADKVLDLEALPVRTVEVSSPGQGRGVMTKLLEDSGVANAAVIVDMLYRTSGMRGAILLDADTLERLEPDHQRGVRATLMDDAESACKGANSCKEHYAEAIVLATKVAHAPGMTAELCISDDPDYTTGYIASRKLGYVRITRLKSPGSPQGGRIFLCRTKEAPAERIIDYLERAPVRVTGVQPLRREGVFDKTGFVNGALESLKRGNLFRDELIFDSAAAPCVELGGRGTLLLSSNDYLDLARDERVVRAAKDALEKFGLGSGGSRLTTGSTVLHRELEHELAGFKETEDALVFNTGFAANSGIIPALCPPEGVIFSDELNHASIIDGCRAAKARTVIYRHCDMHDLAEKVRTIAPRQGGLIVSDAVFSMDGDIAPLPDILDTAQEFGLFTMLDEAHSTGVIGKTGHGIREHFSESRHPDILMGTLSKALGAEGGFVCCTAEMRRFLYHRCRSFIFSTSLPAAVMAGALAALEIIESEPERVRALRGNVKFFIAELAKHGIQCVSDSAIVPIHIGDEEKAASAAVRLRTRGIVIPAIRYPTVKRGEARLRAALMATHTHEQLAFAARIISQSLRETKKI
ncbi:MAG: 6-carboxyhexanoate--CoA ligase [Lentisphaeria bacterium]|nr:6-carboxyhexanoate--CoA ligase [Lentisphaeria bacterium]